MQTEKEIHQAVNGLISLTAFDDTIYDYTGLVEHVKTYIKKTKSDLLEDLKDFEYRCICYDGRFITFNVYKDYIEIGPSCCDWRTGDCLFWHIGTVLKINKLRTRTERNPMAYARLTHSKLIEVLEDGSGILEKELPNGR